MKITMKIREIIQNTKMPPGRSHTENRKYVCVCCGLKIQPKWEMRDNLLDLFKTYVWQDYNPKLLSNPTGLCNICKKNLYTLKKGSKPNSSLFHSWIINQERLKLLPRFKGKHSI